MMFKIIISLYLLLSLFVVYSDFISQNKISQNDLYRRLIFNQVYSFYECQHNALIIRNALKNHVPLANTPQHVITENDVSFVLFTRNHLNPYTLKISTNELSIRSSPFDASKRIVLYVNGYGLSYNSVFPDLPQGLLNNDVNAIFVNFNKYAFVELQYFRNITVPLLGGIVAKFAQQLIAVGSNPKKMYFVGFSAGGEVVGLAAKRIVPKIARLLAIDPEGSCYNFLPSSERVDKSDADFVEIVHCSVGYRALPGFILGDVTFYMNGGYVQPPCYNQTSITDIVQCSHGYCYDYFIKSLYNFNMSIGIRCNTYINYLQNNCDCNDREIFGYYTPSSARGLYFVDTTPYSHSNRNLLCSEKNTWF